MYRVFRYIPSHAYPTPGSRCSLPLPPASTTVTTHTICSTSRTTLFPLQPVVLPRRWRCQTGPLRQEGAPKTHSHLVSGSRPAPIPGQQSRES